MEGMKAHLLARTGEEGRSYCESCKCSQRLRQGPPFGFIFFIEVEAALKCSVGDGVRM